MERIIDILEPVKGETFFSWLFRMINIYSSESNAKKYSKVSKNILNSLGMPDLFWPENVEEIVNRCNLQESVYLSSFSTVIEQMTNINFYTDVCCGDKIRFDSCDEYKEFYKTHKYNPNQWYGEGRLELVFCPECLKERKEPVFYREHQLKGNTVCWKHGCVLKHTKYLRQWIILKSIYDLSFAETAEAFSLDKEELEIATQLAKEVHGIFESGLKNTPDIIIKKMMQKLFYDNKEIWKRQYSFKDCQSSFLIKLKEQYFSKLKFRCDFKELYEALFYKRKYEFHDPMFFIACVCGIFGSFENMYSYELKSEMPDLNWKRSTHTLNYYEDTLPDAFFNEYDVLGEYEEMPIVKHRSCGLVVVNFFDDLHSYHCPLCKEKVELVEAEDKVFLRNKYIDESSFRKLHGGINSCYFNCLIRDGILECIEYGYHCRLFPADFIFTKDIKRLLYKKYGIFADEFEEELFICP